MLAQLTASTAVELKPLRLNFAQTCIWCSQRWCESPRCVALHAASRWTICDLCNGTGNPVGAEWESCPCAGGLMEANPNAASVELIRAETAPRCLTCGLRTWQSHSGCVVPDTLWTPCPSCAGRRIDAEGSECVPCCGVGFTEIDPATDTLAERAEKIVPKTVAVHVIPGARLVSSTALFDKH
jgi:hypothetical protein